MHASGAAGPSGRGTTNWPHYDAMATGLRNYWYPVVWSKAVKDRPYAFRLAGESIAQAGRSFANTRVGRPVVRAAFAVRGGIAQGGRSVVGAFRK